MVGGVRMAFGALISLVFQRQRLAASMSRFVKTLNHINQIRGRDGQAFPLPSRIPPARTRKTAMGGAIRVESVGFSGIAAPRPFRRHCPNSLNDHSKPTEGRRCFYLAVQPSTASKRAGVPLDGKKISVWQVWAANVSWHVVGTTWKGRSMGTRKILLIALFGILLGTVAGQSALADDVAQFATFLKDPVMRQNLINAAAKSTVIVQNPCSAAQYSVATTPIVLKPMVFDSAGHPAAGMLKFPVKEEGCGITRILNTLIWVQGPGTAGTAALAPGTTHADPVLQKDASMRAYTAAVVAARPDAACNVKYLADTEFIERENSGSPTPSAWRESWTIVLCNKKVVVPVKFIPDPKGTTIVAGGPETKVSNLEGAPQ